MRDIDQHLAQTLLSNREQYINPGALAVCDDQRDYVLDFSYEGNKDIPLAPTPEASKESKRLNYMKEFGVLNKEYDHSALDMVAQVAANKLNCAIGVVTVIDEKQLHSIDTYNLQEAAHTLPRDEALCMHTIHAEKPMIVKNPQRDMRFRSDEGGEELGMKFYAGFPVRAPDGTVVASLCVCDAVTHNNISTKDYATMEALTKLAADLIVPKSPA